MNHLFSSVGLTDALVANLNTIGFVTPTPVQEQAIPHILAGRDVCACAATGTGKTGAYLLPIIDVLTHSRKRIGMPRAIILTPTRELAMQVVENFKSFAKGTDLKCALLVGGEWVNEQEKQLKRKPDIIIATPGRLMDVQDRGKVITHDVRFLVIDEADRMLDMGFMPDVEKIISFCPKNKQMVLFSATFPDEIQGLVSSVLNDPKRIEVSAQSQPAQTISQYKVLTTPDNKRPMLRALLKKHQNESAIVFCNRKKDVDIVAKSLSAHGFKCMPIHGDLSQNIRNETLDRFRSEKGLILVASDVAARGIDIDELPLVINFDLPINAEDYIHRIGRTGRAGNLGIAYSLVTPKDDKLFKAIKKLIGKDIEEIEMEISEDLQSKRGKRIQEKDESRKPSKQRHPETRTENREERVPVVGFGSDTPKFMQVDLGKYLGKSAA